jgi:hypothetical protein
LLFAIGSGMEQCMTDLTIEAKTASDAGDETPRAGRWFYSAFRYCSIMLTVLFVNTLSDSWRHEFSRKEAISFLELVLALVPLCALLLEIGRRRGERYDGGDLKTTWAFIGLFAGTVFGFCVAALRNS